MSADNGIYILKTGREYRVKHLHAIQNLYWSNVKEACEESLNCARLLDEFHDCRSTRSAEMAIKIAMRLRKEIPYCEYGIQILDTTCFWRDIVKNGIEIVEREMQVLNESYAEGNWRRYEKIRLERLLHKYNKNNSSSEVFDNESK